MTRERRYRDDEVREIFETAARRGVGEPAAASDPEGLTLADLQDIGREVGLAPTVVARAAAALDRRAAAVPRRTSLGMPIGVGRIVALPRPPTDAEWEQLVGVLRSTFRARGRVSSQGNLREWVNGNLHACIEPAESGYRLRLGTVKGDAAALNALGATGVVTGAIAFGALLMSGGLAESVFVPWMIGASGVGAVLANALRLPRWAERREEQMNRVAAAVGTIMEADSTMDDREP